MTNTNTITADMIALTSLLFDGRLYLSSVEGVSNKTDIYLMNSARNIVGTVWYEDDLLWIQTEELQPVIREVLTGERPHPGLNGRPVGFQFMPGCYCATLTKF